MDTEIRILGIDLTGALQLYIERRLRSSLSRFGGRVGRVRVRITDVNGPRGGPDKSCHISAELLPSGMTLLHQAVRISTPPSAELRKESAARSRAPLDGTANAGGNARRCGFPGGANP